ncbi:tetratricopeptide repeat protein [Flavobacterium tegetincola]|uniref:tetratricopeptide repeat protein n=1 Tax=Flavobacterium tegetincola TaxID=150172 RepID=UPI000424AF94|nr:tetratricopeptide repeat protein [Flavobacterium tegetincola]
MKSKLIILLLFFSFSLYSQKSEFTNLKDDAIKLLMNNDANGSLTKINQAININSQNADAYYIRGNVYEKKGLIEDAKKDYLKAIQLNPKHGDAMSKCAIMYGKQKDMINFCYYVKKACDLGSADACGMKNRFCN